MQKIIVFLGPSLDQAAAERILSAHYLPPARRGDLLAAAEKGATIIGLIDGVFHQESAVAHREILAAIKKGVRVVGASSMGALRAAEMDTLGMVGIGEIYRMYKSGELESDDEVALVFDPSSGLCTLRAADQYPVHPETGDAGRDYNARGTRPASCFSPFPFLSEENLPGYCCQYRGHD